MDGDAYWADLSYILILLMQDSPGREVVLNQ